MKNILKIIFVMLILGMLAISFNIIFNSVDEKLMSPTEKIYNSYKSQYADINKVRDELHKLESDSIVKKYYEESKELPTNEIILDSLNKIILLDGTSINNIKNKRNELLQKYNLFYTNLYYGEKIYSMDIDLPPKEHLKYFPIFEFNDFDILKTITYDYGYYDLLVEEINNEL